jgi:type II secretory pathway pseudopilin PulG
MKGITLVEVIIAVFLISIVLLGLLSAFYFGFRLLSLNERKITATQIAQGEIEKIRNMQYLDIGTIGAQLPYASGTLEVESKVILNGIEYKIERKVKFVSDLTDGSEACPLDYKKVEIKVSFSDILKGEVVLTTDIAPKNKIEEIQACSLQPAGILTVQVLDTKGNLISNPKIEIFNPNTGELIDSASPSSGKYDFPLSSGNYRVVVSKEGYSSERTYSVEEIAIPENPNPNVLEGKITQISLVIDKISSMTVQTLSTYGEDFFSESFDNEEKISQKENITIFNGQAQLATNSEGYLPSGYLLSKEISPQNLTQWEEFSFENSKPLGTEIKYQIYFASDSEWLLIPDSDLPGNSLGFTESPINLTNLPISYSKLKIKATFTTNSTSFTPILYNWQLRWKTSNPVSIPNVKFDMRGEKIIGKDSNEHPIYKFSTTTQTDLSGKIQLQNLEWDVYHFSNFQKDSQSLEVATSTPTQPVSLDPDTNLTVSFYLESTNSLLVTVLDSQTLKPIFSATTTLSSNNFSQTQYTDFNGQTLFLPLNSQYFNLLVEATGYNSTSTSVLVSGKTTIVVKLDPSE